MPSPLILIVDDDLFMRVALKDSLESGGYEIIQAEHGDAALAKLESVTPELIILDLFMPERSGLSTLEEIRKRHPTLPVIVVSSLDTEATVEEARRLGASDFISKPFHPEEISLAVRSNLRAGR